jgi:hypothetical protein
LKEKERDREEEGNKKEERKKGYFQYSGYCDEFEHLDTRKKKSYY